MLISVMYNVIICDKRNIRAEKEFFQKSNFYPARPKNIQK